MNKLFTWDKSGNFQFSWYDIYSTFRDFAILLLSLMATNMDDVSQFLTEHGANPSLVSTILFVIVQLSRKFVKDYKG